MEAEQNPRIIVQADWDQAFRESNGKAWVTFRKHGQQSVYGDLSCEGFASNGNPYVTATDGFQVEDTSRKSMTISYRTGDQTCRCSYLAPCVSFTSVHSGRKAVESMDVTPGGLAVSCDNNGKLTVWTTDNGETRRDLEGHLSDVYTCKFFPSGIVILSGGADMQLKIWSAETGQCAANLVGHKAGITDTAIVEKGRNIVSVSKDGTAKLWDVGNKACITTIEELGGQVNGCSLGAVHGSINLGVPDSPAGDREVLTEGKLLLLACENKTLQGFGLHSRKKIFESTCSDSVNCCTFLSQSLLACGTQDSHMYVFDIRNMGVPLYHKQENRSAILSLLPYQQGLFASTADGSCFLLNEVMEISLELTGSDCDPVYSVVSDEKYIYTSCRDGIIRKYSLS